MKIPDFHIPGGASLPMIFRMISRPAAAVVLLFFGLASFFWLGSAVAERGSLLRAERSALDSAPPPAARMAMEFLPDDGSSLSLGRPGGEKTEGDFQWPGDMELIPEALQFFLARKDYVPALLAASLLPGEQYPVAKRLELVSRIYAENFGKCFRAESARAGRPPEGRFLPERLMFLENIRIALLADAVPETAANCMILKFVGMNESEYPPALCSFLLKKAPRPEPWKSGEGAAFASRMMSLDSDLMSRLAADVWTRTARGIAGSASWQEWIRRTPLRTSERRTMEKFLRGRIPNPTPRDFADLPVFARYLVARNFFREYGPADSSFCKALAGGALFGGLWLDSLSAAERPTRKLLVFLRNNSRWNDALWRGNYASAPDLLIADWKSGAAPLDLPEPVLDSIKAGVALESALASRILDPDRMKKMKLAVENPGKNPAAEFESVLRNSFRTPFASGDSRERTEQELLSLAARINRGRPDENLTYPAGVPRETLIEQLKMKEFSDE